MKKIAESLGMAEPQLSYSIGDGTEVKTEMTTETELVDVQLEEADTTKEDKFIDAAFVDLDDIIRDGKFAFKQMFDAAGDMEPRYQSRYKEVGATYMKNTLDAIKQKMDFAHKQKEHKVETLRAQTPVMSKTQINNIYTDRESIMRAIETDEDDM